MAFELFDPQAELDIRVGSLPHWYQPGVTYFVTFRTEDSVPQPLVRGWHARRNEWLDQHGIDPNRDDWKARLQQSPAIEQDFHATFTREFFDYLDRGHGRYVLSDPKLAKEVADSLVHFNGTSYHLGDFVVMPNHVHLLVCLLGSTELETQCKSWKRFTATKINRLLKQTGRFWQEESFDHLVRSPEQFEHFRRYIAANPDKARLRPGQYLLKRDDPK